MKSKRNFRNKIGESRKGSMDYKGKKKSKNSKYLLNNYGGAFISGPIRPPTVNIPDHCDTPDDNYVFYNRNISNEMKVAALYMIYGGCRYDDCRKWGPPPPYVGGRRQELDRLTTLGEAITLWLHKNVRQGIPDVDANAPIRDKLWRSLSDTPCFRFLAQLRRDIITALENVSQFGNDPEQMMDIEQQFNEVYDLTALGSGFADGAFKYLLMRFSIKNENNHWIDGWNENCNNAIASLRPENYPVNDGTEANEIEEAQYHQHIWRTYTDEEGNPLWLGPRPDDDPRPDDAPDDDDDDLSDDPDL
jgi:hypothetical protein